MRKDWITIDGILFMTRCHYSRKMPNGHICPCGHCLYCRTVRARELAFRCEQEAFDKYVFNVLITYDELCVPKRNGKMTLNKVHFQDFMKRFREWFYRIYKQRVRYLCVGEYGGKLGRPHYHAIFFTDTDLKDRKKDYYEGRHVPYSFISQKLTEFWRKGACDVEPMTNVGGSVKYLIQYLLTHNKSIDGVEKPFTLMSRGRGLGHRWLDRTKSFQRFAVANDSHLIKHHTEQGSVIVTPVPRYYKRKYIPKEVQERASLDHLWASSDYEQYLKKLLKNETDCRKWREVVTNLREKEQRDSERSYRERKIHDNGRSAGRVFARIAKKRKG